jgi:hypothetical protein
LAQYRPKAPVGEAAQRLRQQFLEQAHLTRLILWWQDQSMLIQQTVEIPASRRIVIEVPPDVPVGKTILIKVRCGEAAQR